MAQIKSKPKTTYCEIFRGRKTPADCVVELDTDGYGTQLALEKSLRVVDYSLTGFEFGDGGSGPAQLAAAILNEVTDDPELTRTYYQLFKFDHVAKWDGVTFEISEDEVRNWLQSVGAPIEPPKTEVIHTKSTRRNKTHHSGRFGVFPPNRHCTATGHST